MGLFVMFVFISGAITDNPNYEEQFAKREQELKELGHYPYNPVKIGERLKKRLGREPTYDEYLQEDLLYLDRSDAINHLEGWENSNGANIEHKRAIEKNKIILEIKMLPRRW